MKSRFYYFKSRKMGVFNRILIPAAAALASKSSAHAPALEPAAHSATVLAVAPVHAITPAHTVAPAGKKFRIILLHLNAVINPLLIQLGRQLRNFRLQAGSLLSIRILFGQFTSEFELFLIEIPPQITGLLKKSLPLLVQPGDLFVAQITLVT